MAAAKILKVVKMYGVLGLSRLFLDVVWTKLLLPQARIIRKPFYIKKEGTLILGPGFSCGPGLIMDILGEDAVLEIGKDLKVYHNLHIGVIEKVTIGDRVLIASGVYISDHSHGTYSGAEQSSPLTPPNDRPLVSSPVTIGDDCWLGERVCVLPGVTIGKGVTVGAGSVVTSSLPDYVIAAGSPARVIKQYNFETQQWESAKGKTS